MSISRLEKISKDLSKDTYNVHINLGDFMLVKAQRGSLNESPTNDLLFMDQEKSYSVPLYVGVYTLKDVYSFVDKLVDWRIDSLINVFKGILKEGGMPWEDYFRKEIKSASIVNSKEVAKEMVWERESSLHSLYSYLTPELTELTLKHIRDVGEEDRSLIKEFDEKNSEVERLDTFVNTAPLLNTMGWVANVLSCGELKRNFIREIEKYAERNLAWDVLSQSAKMNARNLSQDADYLSSQGNIEFSDQLKKIASFYENMSIFSAQGHSRMKKLLDRAFNLYGTIIKYKAPDVDNISKQFIEKVFDLAVFGKRADVKI